MNIAVPLANDGYFLAVRETLGVTGQDLDDAVAGRMTPERQRAIQERTDEAIIALARTAAAGRC